MGNVALALCYTQLLWYTKDTVINYNKDEHIVHMPCEIKDINT